jgi:1,4-alpha-glucan branching enzyme
VECLNTDAQKYGGSGVTHPDPIETREWNAHAWPYALEITVPPLAVVVFKLQR